MIIFVILLGFSVLLESSLTTAPLVLSFLIALYLLKREVWIFPLAFFTGVILDSLLLRPFGQTSLFFVMFILLIEIYERKFEIKTFPFVFMSSFLGSLAYLIIFGGNIFPNVLISAFLAYLFFKIL